MEVVKRIIQKLKLISDRNQKSIESPMFSSETDYYKWFFTKNTEWNQPAPNYDEQIRWEGIRSFVEIVKRNHVGILNILDLGCGRGWMTNLLSEYGKVIGVEPISPVADYASNMFPHLNIFCGDSNYLLNNGNDGKFDLIISSEVIEHVEENNKPGFVLNLYKLLKKEGFLIVSTPRREVLNEYCKYINPSQPIEDWMTEAEVKKLFLENRFTVSKMERLTKKIKDKTIDLDVYQLWLLKKV